jgi:acyl-CoA thioesterase-1
MPPPQLTGWRQPGQPATVVVYGTSLSTEWTPVLFWQRRSGYWVTRLRERLAGSARVINASGWGQTSDWGRVHLEERVLRHQPDLVLIEFAINDADIRRAISTLRARGNLEQMVERIRRARPSAVIALLTMNVCSGRPAWHRPGLARHYEVVRETAQAGGLPLIDLEPAWKKLLDQDPATFHNYVPDGIHPNRSGCERMIGDPVETALL